MRSSHSSGGPPPTCRTHAPLKVGHRAPHIQLAKVVHALRHRYRRLRVAPPPLQQVPHSVPLRHGIVGQRPRAMPEFVCAGHAEVAKPGSCAVRAAPEEAAQRSRLASEQLHHPRGLALQQQAQQPGAEGGVRRARRMGGAAGQELREAAPPRGAVGHS